MKTRKPDVIKIIGLLLSSLFITFVIIEIALRLISYSYSPLQIKFKGMVHDWRFEHSFKDEHFAYDPFLLWRPKKNYSIFNTQGFRGREFSTAKKDNEIRIFAIGDSNTLGWAGKDGPNWPTYLEKLLTNEYKNISVINAGVWGYSSFQGLGRFKETLFFQPDMVLISFGCNDAHKVEISDAEFNKMDFTFYQKTLHLHKFKIGQLIIAFWQTLDKSRKDKKSGELVHRVSSQEYKDNLEQIIEISKRNNIKCVLLTRPFIGKSPNKIWWKNFAPLYNDATFEVGNRNFIPVIDIYSHFKDKKEYFIDESHFNEEGHRLAAEFIYHQIKSLL
ncbi:MAG: SGNH/GDSL hydrolase family protein [Planctomycetota bacterium]